MNRRRIYTLLALALLLSSILTACRKGAQSPRATGTPTSDPSAALFPTSLPIVAPSPIPTPTSTPTVVPTPTPILLTPPPSTDYQPPAPGSIAPFVIQRSPGRGEELGLDQPIELVFDRPMNRASVEQALVVSVDSGETLDGKLEWTGDRVVRFKPSSLVRDTRYHVHLGQEAKGQEGIPLNGDYRFKFNTTGFLEVTQTIPADGSTDLELDGTIVVMFNRPVVPLTTISLSSVDLPHPLRFDPPIEGTGEWLNTSIYVFTPSEPLAYGTAYTARVEVGLSDVTGGLLAEDYIWQFTTLPPKVVRVLPCENQEFVPPGTTVVVQFNQAVDGDSAISAFRLFPQDGQDVPGKFESRGDTLVFTPTIMLDFGATYQVEVAAGVQSAGGSESMRDDFRWSFKTVPLPRIVGTSPRDGDQNADYDTNFVIEFSAPIDPATVMPNLEMSPPISPGQVYTYSRDRTFTLDFGAQPNTDYEVRIGPDITDPYGNETGQDLTVRFHTRDLPPPEPPRPSISLRVPGSVGTYDADQPIRLTVAHRNTDRLNLELYQLNPEQFIQDEDGDEVRDWSVNVSSPKDETQYATIDLVTRWGRQLSPGIYLCQVGAPGVEHDHYHTLVVSEINLTLKVASDEALVWATDLTSGAPIENLELIAQDAHGQNLGHAVTGDDGLARFELPNRSGRSSLYVHAKRPFVLASEDWNHGIRVENFGIEGSYREAGYRAHVYTDREIYRPNQTVYFRGLVRAEDDVQYRLPDLRQVHVWVYDAEGQVLFDGELTLDVFGAFHGGITLGEEASLGAYRIQVRSADGSTELDAGAFFQVAEYRAPEFEVTVTPDEAEIVRGKATRVTVDANYFFGAPVADAQVEWNVLAESYAFQPLQFGRYRFRDVDDPWTCWWWPVPRPQPIILSGSGQTNRNGQLIIELPADIGVRGSESVASRQLTVEAVAYGRDGQVISGRSQIVVHRGEFYIGLAPQRYVGRVNEEMAVDVVTVDWDGERLPNQELKYAVYGYEEDPVADGKLTTDANGGGAVRFTPTQGGAYHVVVSGRDRGERLVRSSVFVWVSGGKYVSWRRENDDRLTLISDKTSYAPGETAEILIPSPFEGDQWAWITVERGGVLHREVLQLESNSHVYRLPITTSYAPNVYVSAVIVQGREPNGDLADYKVGYVALDVSTEQRELTVTLTPSTEKAGPGETVSFEIRASDYTGKPVAAEFSLDLVDEAVLTLRPRIPDAIVGAFYGRRRLGVHTASGLSVSVNRLSLEEPEQDDDQVQVVLEVEAVMEEAQMGAAPPSGVKVREEFADTAYWRADVVTGQDGRATVEVTLPDNLTTWVMRGIGATVETQVGEATTEIIATKPLLVRPVTPRFFVVGDRVQLAANVSNN